MKQQKLHFQKFTLPNGVRLILVPMQGINSVATSVMVGTGSRYETEEWNGISHFLEHIVFKGTKKYPTTDDVNIIESIGGLQNAYTGIDITNFHNKVFASDWQLALEINKELAIHPLLEEKHIDKERDVIIEEMKRYEDQPEAKAEETFHMMMYPKTKLGMRIIGTEKSLKNITSKELKSYHDMQYAPKNIVVVLTGNIDLEKGDNISEIRSQVENWFGGMKEGPLNSIEKVIETQNLTQVKIVTKPDAQQAHFFVGIRTFPRNNQDRFAWSVFNLLMGVGFTSRLFKEIREKRGLCYHISSNSDNFEDVGLWNVYAGVATAKVEEALKAIMYEFSKIVKSGASSDEVEIAKKRLKTMISFRSENPEFVNEYYGRQEVYHQKIITINDYLARISQVSKDDVNQVIKKYLHPKTLNLALVWNKTGKEEKLGKLLVM